ncbi:hypothetical protein BBW65_04840 [Helicobacter enhydrae]|uniref:ABC transporter n=1 Tax=Helicobacter enhydrae TaxID=222136 RepID=A0A1B1U5Y3_9HELI|nr:ABC transporter permease [Helicobacter enhydrae]ANV98166.1 hypothetical protein BBW65_04840 [Helicobacter enhydrae]
MRTSVCAKVMTLHFEGVCDYDTFTPLNQKDFEQYEQVLLDCAKIEKMDFSFVVYLDSFFQEMQLPYEVVNAQEEFLEMFALATSQKANLTQQTGVAKSNLVTEIGKKVYATFDGFLNFLDFFGNLVSSLLMTLLHPSLLRFRALLYHLNHSAFRALPIGLSTCFIVSAAISVQGVLQLQKMGAGIVSVETMAKLALREMGPFILALVIAGRSASSYTAQIGVMRITEELDAMKTMGFDWFRFIVLPRFLALIIGMPLLVFVADFASLFASALVIMWQTGITFSQYVERFYENVGMMHMWIGVIKAPFFGAAIAIVGCYRGFEIRGDTQSVGNYTTISVVNALFWIIALNALFSVIFTRFDV